MIKLKILFVCTGNICRSPVAEGIFLDHIFKNNLLSSFEVDSAGTTAYHSGSKPDSRSIILAKKHLITLNHIARQITPNDLDYYDFILVMDHRNYEDVIALTKNPQHKSKIFLLRSFDLTHDENSEYAVPDPYYGQDADFEEVFTICKNSIEGFMKYLSDQNLL